MIITFFRSSSFNEFNICQQQYFLEYVLGIPNPSGKKAEKGTIVHKVMEGLAKGKLARQKKETEYSDSVLGVHSVSDLEDDDHVERLLYKAFDYYTNPQKTIHEYAKRDLNDCGKWVFMGLRQGGGMFDPRRRNIVAVEPYFEIEIPCDWAHYCWDMPDGSVIGGQLQLKLTIDLVTQTDDKIYEVIDWKTGRRMDWSTCIEKSFVQLDNDPQLRIYHYGLAQKFPEVKHWALTMNYINDGGPFTMHFGLDDIRLTLEMLEKQYKRICNTTRPSLKGRGKHWFCSRVCHYGKTPCDKDPTKSICQFTKDKLIRVGIDATVQEETHKGFTIGQYDSPGE